MHYAAAFQAQVDLYPNMQADKLMILRTEKDFASVVRKLHAAGANVKAADKVTLYCAKIIITVNMLSVCFVVAQTNCQKTMIICMSICILLLYVHIC